MVARFQVDVEGGPPGFPSGLGQGDPFGMRTSRYPVISGPDHLTAPDHYRPHHRVGRSPA